MNGLSNAFSGLLEFVLGWLPSGLYKPVVAVFAAAFLIILVKIVLAIVEVLTKVLDLFIFG